MHRVSEHASTKYSTFYLLYNQELTSLTDIKFDFARVEEKYSDKPFDKETFDAVSSTAVSIRENFIKLLEKAFPIHKQNNTIIIDFIKRIRKGKNGI